MARACRHISFCLFASFFFFFFSFLFFHFFANFFYMKGFFSILNDFEIEIMRTYSRSRMGGHNRETEVKSHLSVDFFFCFFPPFVRFYFDWNIFQLITISFQLCLFGYCRRRKKNVRNDNAHNLLTITVMHRHATMPTITVRYSYRYRIEHATYCKFSMSTTDRTVQIQLFFIFISLIFFFSFFLNN